MQALLEAKVRRFLASSLVLAAWMLLAAQPGLAQTQGLPNCPPNSSGITSPNDKTIAESITFDGEITASTRINYFRIRIPALGVGELTVESSSDGQNETLTATAGVLCRGSSRIASDDPDPDPEPTDNGMEPGHFMITGEPVTAGDYFVAVRGEDDAVGTYTLNVTFTGVLPRAGTSTDKGSLTTNNQRDQYNIEIVPAGTRGLLTVRTTGNTDTKGGLLLEGTPAVLTSGMADAGGSGGNFEVTVPATNGDYEVYVEGQNPTTRGDYAVEVDFHVAEIFTDATSGRIEGLSDDYEIANSADGIYFFVRINGAGLLTVETIDPADTSQGTSDTTGTLYGPNGAIATDSSSGAASHFRIRAPADDGQTYYIVKVDGTAGRFRLQVSFANVEPEGHMPLSDTTTSKTLPGTLTAPGDSGPAPVHRYVLNIKAAGTLDVRTTGSINTVGVLYGPDGRQIAEDDNSGTGTNFRMAEQVETGLYLVTVEGRTRATGGDYNLHVTFIEGALGDQDPTPPVDPTPPGDDQDPPGDDDQCPMPVETDATGYLENPSQDGFRSGIGVISGWVCAANEVQVLIYNEQSVLQETLTVAYGTDRPDTVGQCNHLSPNTGFGMMYNFNHLPEGTYTMYAFADDTRIGTTVDFEVVHLTDFSINDTNRFLTNLPAAQCRVDNFPADGEQTLLRWEQSTQNFVIRDAG